MEEFLTDIGLPYVPRSGKSLGELLRENGADGVIIWQEQGPVLQMGDEQFFFHPSMAKIRIGAYRKKKQEDPMIKACGLKEGSSFLDCTLGLGADAIVAAYFTQTTVVGIESSPIIAAIIKWGMRRFVSDISWLSEPITRIQVYNSDHNTFLSQQKDSSFDVVYFDPMFRPAPKESALVTLAQIGGSKTLSINTIQQACRVARYRVVVKKEDLGRV